jgi:hypothetical protein
MSYGSYTYNKVQLGQETTNGTAVAADIIWRGPFGDIEDARTRNIAKEQVGLLVPAERSYDSQIAAMISMPETELTFEHFPHILQAAIQSATPTGSGPYVYAYAFPTGTTPNTIATYTIEAGNAVVTGDVREVAYCFVESFTISGRQGEAWKVSANWRGRAVAESTFTGSLTLSALEEALFSRTQIFIDASGGTIGTTQETGVLVAASFDVTTGIVPVFVGDGNLFFLTHKFIRPTVNFTLTLELESTDTTVKEERDAYEANSVRLISLDCDGTSGRNLLINGAYKYDSVGTYQDDNGNTTVQLSGHAVYSSADTLFWGVDVTNNLTALP